MKAHLEVCRRYGVRIIVTSVGDPSVNAPLIHDAGILHFHDATTIRFAEKAAKAGVDGIVAIGAGGGGHAGIISHLALIPLIRAMFDGTIVMAGAVSSGAIDPRRRNSGRGPCLSRHALHRHTGGLRARRLQGDAGRRRRDRGDLHQGCQRSAGQLAQGVAPLDRTRSRKISSSPKAAAPIICPRARSRGATSGAPDKESA